MKITKNYEKRINEWKSLNETVEKKTACQHVLEYTNCIPWKGDTLLLKGCLGYDTKLHLIVRS